MTISYLVSLASLFSSLLLTRYQVGGYTNRKEVPPPRSEIEFPHLVNPKVLPGSLEVLEDM